MICKRLFLFFTVLLVTAKVSTFEFENENAKKTKFQAPSNNTQTSPLTVDKVYNDEKNSKLDDLFTWITDFLIPKPKPKTPPNPTPEVPQNPMSPPSDNSPPSPIENDTDVPKETPSSHPTELFGPTIKDCRLSPCTNRGNRP